MRYIGQYLAAIWGDWVSRMSGIAGLLLIVIAFAFRLTDVGQARYWVGAAAVCFVIASFSAWRTERLNVERLDRVIKSLEQSTGQVALSPRELVKVYEGRTSIAAAKLASASAGKAVTVTGKVDDVSPSARIALYADGVLTFLHFDESLSDAVAALQKGDLITARGQIRGVENSYVSLEKCELIKF